MFGCKTAVLLLWLSCHVNAWIESVKPRGASFLSVTKDSVRYEQVPIPIDLASWSSVTRATELSQILLKYLICPTVKSLVMHGLPKSAEEFWTRPNLARGVREGLEIAGPTYVKFGQALSSRADIVPIALANELAYLQDQMEPFDNDIAIEMLEDELPQLVACLRPYLSQNPVAAASIGQVYKAEIPFLGTVAVKVQRPDINERVEQDSRLLITFASIADMFVRARVTEAVDEFISRIREEFDFQNECNNMRLFASLYDLHEGTSKNVRVVVPKVYPQYCSEHIIIMEWIDGVKLSLIDGANEGTRAENLQLIQQGIECTLSQLLDTGVLHADPHLGNLVKVHTYKGPKLGYFDFGMLSRVPVEVRDGLVAAVVLLVFSRDVEAIAALFSDLQLLPKNFLRNIERKQDLARALEQTFADVLVFEENGEQTPGSVSVPTLRFDKLLLSLTSLVSKFEFQLPPYFLNNARALATLEGVARSLDPSFNVLTVVYPFALRRLVSNPSKSQVIEGTLYRLIRSPITGLPDPAKIASLLDEISHLTGDSRRQIISNIVFSPGGSRLLRKVYFHYVFHRPLEDVGATSMHFSRRYAPREGILRL